MEFFTSWAFIGLMAILLVVLAVVVPIVLVVVVIAAVNRSSGKHKDPKSLRYDPLERE